MKEQDALITLIRRLIIEPYDGLVTISTIEAVRMVQQMIEEHVVNPRGSKLQKYVLCGAWGGLSPYRGA